MRRPIAIEIARLGGDPGDEVWRWFTTNGPHGTSHFNWSKAKRSPGAYVAFEQLQQVIVEKRDLIDDFDRRAHDICAISLMSTSVDFVIRALQVSAAIGAIDLLDRILPLRAAPHDEVAVNAKACEFYLRRVRHDARQIDRWRNAGI